jgi:type IV fimbrial biogenesis protein FimU
MDAIITERVDQGSLDGIVLAPIFVPGRGLLRSDLFFVVMGMERLRSGNMRGFSLIELMITLALFSILCLAAIPAFLRFAENGNLKSATRDITTDIAIMKETAMNRGVDCQIAFNTGANNFTLTTPDGNQVKTPASFSQDIVITNAIPTMTFQPRGTATPPGTITLQNNRGSTATITVNITGRTYAAFTMQ